MQSRKFELLLCILPMLFESEILLRTVSPPAKPLSSFPLGHFALSSPAELRLDWLKRDGSQSSTVRVRHTAISRKAVSEKVQAKIPQSIVGNFVFCLFFKEIWLAIDVCLRVLKESNQWKRVRQLRCQEQCIDHIPYYLLGIVACTCFQTTFLEIAAYMVTSKYSLRVPVM